MTTLKPYPAYRDSGVEWLGDVPEHWDTVQLARLADERKVRNIGMAETTVLSLSYGRIIVKARSVGGLTPADYSTYQIVEPDSIVLRLTDLQNDQRSLRVGRAEQRGIITSAYVCLKPERITGSRYLYRALHDFDIKKMLYGMGAGVRQGLSYRELRKALFPLPPLPEQRAIADFLDAMDARITRFIAARKKMIRLLEEKKQAVINQAVTRGLDPDVQVKDSGVDWLGDIPAHWERRAVGQLFSTGRGVVTSHEFIHENLGPYPVYSSQTANSGEMGRIDTYMFEGNYLTWTTDGAHAGTVFLRSGRFNCTNVCGTLRPKLDMDLAFARYALSAETKRFVRLDINPKLMNNVMARIRINFPPALEQRTIAEYLDSESARIDAVFDRSRREIELMQEYRTRLISDVVTGKLDVRGMQLPTIEVVIGEEIEAATEDEDAEGLE